ncbi:MAG: helix-turn-helix transcriptional regulator [Hydrogenophaga sp.]|nr:helix-turn-helix transcriptional regulator [Hydrogenophaga sp.]
MSIDLQLLFQAFMGTIGKSSLDDGEFGEIFRQTMAALVRFDYVVVFAYRGQERPISLYSTFDADEHVIFVSLYQAGPYLLDPFFHTALSAREGVYRMRERAPDRFFSSEYYRTYYVQTGLAEEVGFFVDVGNDVTVVLSLMRREQTGAFPGSEIAALKKVESLVSGMVRQYWSNLSARFDAQLSSALDGQAAQSGDAIAERPSDRVWRDLNLTGREASIIDLVLQGHSSESIGLRLNISTGTVKVHRRNVYRKLGISSQTQLLAIYLKSLSGGLSVDVRPVARGS